MPFKEINTQEVDGKCLLQLLSCANRSVFYPLLRVVSALDLSQKAKKGRVPSGDQVLSACNLSFQSRPAQGAEGPKPVSQTLRCGI